MLISVPEGTTPKFLVAESISIELPVFLSFTGGLLNKRQHTRSSSEVEINPNERHREKPYEFIMVVNTRLVRAVT